jgi:hypothetical protein
METDDLGLQVVHVVVDWEDRRLAGVWGSRELAEAHQRVMARRGFIYNVSSLSIDREWYDSTNGTDVMFELERARGSRQR